MADSPNGGPGGLEWSPHSDRLAFGIQGTDTDPSTGTFVVDVGVGAGAGAIHRVATDSTWSVSWAPEGGHLAISTTRISGTSEATVTLDGCDHHLLTALFTSR